MPITAHAGVRADKRGILPSKQISISIECDPNDVYRYAVNPLHLPEWAAGLSGAIARVGGGWISESPMGKVKFRFVKKDDLGALDHLVTLPSGVTIYNPMRVPSKRTCGN